MYTFASLSKNRPDCSGIDGSAGIPRTWCQYASLLDPTFCPNTCHICEFNRSTYCMQFLN